MGIWVSFSALGRYEFTFLVKDYLSEVVMMKNSAYHNPGKMKQRQIQVQKADRIIPVTGMILCRRPVPC